MPQIDVSPRRIGRLFAWIIPPLVVVGAIANYAVYNVAPTPDHPLAAFLKRFDLGHEPSIPAFYSAAVMLLTAIFLTFVARVDKHRNKPHRFWYFLSVLFLALSIDEAALFHEMADSAMSMLDLNKYLYFSWVVPGAIFAAVVGFSSLAFLSTLPARTSRWMIASGVVFVVGAVGMEVVAGVIFSQSTNEEEAMRSLAHVLSQAVEEGLEMVGVAMFLTCLFDYVHRAGVKCSWRLTEQ